MILFGYVRHDRINLFKTARSGSLVGASDELAGVNRNGPDYDYAILPWHAAVAAGLVYEVAIQLVALRVFILPPHTSPTFTALFRRQPILL